ncbi:MAG: AbrB family transcriptional regulator [Limnospira sp. PMC 1291.21]|uniref:Membrane protein AbrB duplication n=3 Tax=Limnospira TaxID=2596745 RepID=A0A9P1P1U5_9CYAN|nr:MULTISPECIES: AbrB family transcriptional regulator [Limnospira]EKD08654.1 membrane protein AbrB duplication [Arthrospira platensis C1]MDC0838914.1 AbrB family transcriptional regulator [Limnoraphis robusta]MDY7055581.1 AbrB family transcriptional regulator [Limnospira fusiformis LS22]QJB29134.1 AbrB family transcriptional regulator [Limnospira fusiformis SAG 85.79]RAQ47574.1 hypothetical protein B9S53_04095 [Arthrospira sp. O9.13F]
MKINSSAFIPMQFTAKHLDFSIHESPLKTLLLNGEKVGVILIEMTIAIMAGWLLASLNMPVGWLIGPMIVGILLALIWQKSTPLPKSFNLVGQAIVALTTATRFSPETLILGKTYALPLLGCIVVTGAMSVCNGYLLWRWAKIDRTTGFLGCIPGAGPSLVAISEQMGADAIAVAVLQYIRILLVALIIPTLASFWFASPGLPEMPLVLSSPTSLSSPPHAPAFLNWLIISVCGGLGVWLGPLLRLPSSLFLGPFLAGLIGFWSLPYTFEMPPLGFTVGLLFVGLGTGLKFDGNTAKKLIKAVLIEVILVIVLILSCLGVGYIFHLITKVDTMTAILGSTPGGITAMIATVLQLGGDSGLVMAMQMTRMLLILLIVPWILQQMMIDKKE